eukprot:jgi/Undpi1/467/HiC_scaffold_1.g00463.m1
MKTSDTAKKFLGTEIVKGKAVLFNPAANDTLRRHLGSLEEKVKRAEEHTTQGDAPPHRGAAGAGAAAVVAVQQPSVTSLCSSGKDHLPELRQLDGILQWLHRAKADIVDGDRSKKQLEGDVRLLYDLLERAKKERKCYGAVVKGLERSVAASEERRAKVEEELEVQQRSFGKVLLKDRDVYEARADAAEKRYASAAEEMSRIITWAEKYQHKYLEAFGKLSSQAEEVGAANLGDLEGFTRDMAKDLHQMRKVAVHSSQSTSLDTI